MFVRLPTYNIIEYCTRRQSNREKRDDKTGIKQDTHVISRRLFGRDLKVLPIVSDNASRLWLLMIQFRSILKSAIFDGKIQKFI